MSVKSTATKQYQAIVNRAATSAVQKIGRPAEGWIATMRKALGMSGTQLGKRLGLSRARISQAEQAEPSGGITLKTMQAAAEAMGGRLVYAIVPANGKVEDIVAAQARKNAESLVVRASTHMALEKQSLSDRQNRQEIERITRELIRTMPADLWTED
jgi:predicted DNA-binding mobile mystery protein A